MKLDIGSIYGPRLDPKLRRYGEVQSIGIGHGSYDYSYRISNTMTGERMGRLEVPPCLTLRQFLDIQESCSD